MKVSLAVWTKLWLIGGTLVLLGVGVPLFIILGFLPLSLLLLGAAMIAAMVGVFLGYYAMVIYVRVNRRGPPRW